jgi:sulfoacetaldehyde acetyltransferase
VLRPAGLPWQQGWHEADQPSRRGDRIVVDRLEGVGAVSNKAIDLQMNQHKTCVIEIMCTREPGDPFRRDALAKPVRFLEKHKDYV